MVLVYLSALSTSPKCKAESFQATQCFEKSTAAQMSGKGAKEAKVSEELLKVLSTPVSGLVKTMCLVSSYEWRQWCGDFHLLTLVMRNQLLCTVPSK